MIISESLLQVYLYERDQVNQVLTALWLCVLCAQRLVPLRRAFAERTHYVAPVS